MAKQLRVLAFVLVILGLFTGTASALQVTPASPVRVKVFYDEDIPNYYETTANTVGEFLEEIDVTIGENDVCTPVLDTPIESGLRIDVSKAFTVYLRYFGAEEDLIPVITRKTTLSQFIEQYSKKTGDTYLYDKNEWYTTLKPDMIIDLGGTIRESVIENVPFTTVYIDSIDLPEGEQKIITEGAIGRQLTTYNVTYLGGTEITRELIHSAALIEPTSAVVQIGIKLPPNGKLINGDKFTFSKELVMNSTAYTADFQSTGKRPGDKGFGICYTGMTAQVGVVAVDPNFIPLYTKLYIDGYGYAVAGDTGGAIKGNKIDLFLNTSEEAINYGRKNVTVYILEDQEKEYIALK